MQSCVIVSAVYDRTPLQYQLWITSSSSGTNPSLIKVMLQSSFEPADASAQQQKPKNASSAAQAAFAFYPNPNLPLFLHHIK